jgi:hypothetical protein
VKPNIGSADRFVRTALGLTIGAAGSRFNTWLGLFGLIPLATGLIGWCPAYPPFGISTRRLRAEGS